ncbi:hypothetical protein EJ06DRAFT_179663 [Trichodelitschia bisporula]|uniref:Uncharacterized protein n=1 Tax=Trichodelitschia bisporula TaxID=703511 RepID=A0A6G1HM65_9PEZI|nr:hypothetical protein EJ06DRAFT_179663 [Trichodelitschia bisporula]
MLWRTSSSLYMASKAQASSSPSCSVIVHSPMRPAYVRAPHRDMHCRQHSICIAPPLFQSLLLLHSSLPHTPARDSAFHFADFVCLTGKAAHSALPVFNPDVHAHTPQLLHFQPSSRKTSHLPLHQPVPYLRISPSPLPHHAPIALLTHFAMCITLRRVLRALRPILRALAIYSPLLLLALDIYQAYRPGPATHYNHFPALLLTFTLLFSSTQLLLTESHNLPTYPSPWRWTTYTYWALVFTTSTITCVAYAISHRSDCASISFLTAYTAIHAWTFLTRYSAATRDAEHAPAPDVPVQTTTAARGAARLTQRGNASGRSPPRPASSIPACASSTSSAR